jgi:protein TonB
MKKFIVLTALFFANLFFAQEPVKALTKEDIPLEVANVVDVSTLNFIVDTEPQFPGGMTEFRKEFSKNFRTSVLQKPQNGVLKTMIYYVVEVDGSILYAKAQGDNEFFNKEAERTLLAVKTKYSPAKVNNLEVRYLLRMPLNMSFK